MEIAAARIAAAEAGLAAADHDGHDDGHQQGREGVDGVGDHHQDPVQPAADVAADQAKDDAGEDGQDDGHDDDQQCGLGAPDHPGEDVIATHGGAEEVLAAGGLLGGEVAVGVGELGEAVGSEQRRKQRGQQERCRSGRCP